MAFLERQAHQNMFKDLNQSWVLKQLAPVKVKASGRDGGPGVGANALVESGVG
jgi:hypothetical protein